MNCIFAVVSTMRIFVLAIIFLTYALIIQSLPNGVVFLSCPKGGGMINCNETKCCPSDNTTCCINISAENEGIRMGCTSVFPRGHPLGC